VSLNAINLPACCTEKSITEDILLCVPPLLQLAKGSPFAYTLAVEVISTQIYYLATVSSQLHATHSGNPPEQVQHD
jgi:hypothetical protein